MKKMFFIILIALMVIVVANASLMSLPAEELTEDNTEKCYQDLGNGIYYFEKITPDALLQFSDDHPNLDVMRFYTPTEITRDRGVGPSVRVVTEHEGTYIITKPRVDKVLVVLHGYDKEYKGGLYWSDVDIVDLKSISEKSFQDLKSKHSRREDGVIIHQIIPIASY